VSTLARPALAEFIGTFGLVFAGCGAIVVEAQTGALGHLGVAITFGLVVMAMIYAVGHVSGAHLNPAVTLAFAVGRHLPYAQAVAHWASQLAAAVVAAAAVRQLVGDAANLGATIPSVDASRAFGLELLLTACLAFVIMSVATDTRAVGEAAAIAIGGTVAMAALFAGPLTGASMNPARSLGPAVVSGATEQLWIYLVAPPIGAIAGALAYQLVRGPARPLRAGDAPTEPAVTPTEKEPIR
jgi:MIP family channel proteins